MTALCHINLLEFIASLIGIWLETLEADSEQKQKRIRVHTDNSSAVGWLHKSNFHPKTQPGHDKTARQLARLLIHSETSLESQHVKGALNYHSF